MVNFDSIVLAVDGNLLTDTNLKDVSFVLAYTLYNKPFPLTGPVVAVGLDDYEEGDIDPIYADNSTIVMFNHTVKVRVSFDIFVPLTASGSNCLNIFRRIVTRLTSSEGIYNFDRYGCSSIKYKRDEAAFVVHGWVEMSTKMLV